MTNDNQRWIRQDLRTLEPEFVIERMKTCLDSHILSSNSNEYTSDYWVC